MTRRELLRLGVIGGAGALGGYIAGRAGNGGHRVVTPMGPNPHATMPGDSLYSHGVEPPESLGPQALDMLTIPPPFEPGARGRARRFELTALEMPVEVARGRTFQAWSYNGTVPGPILRATEGDQLAVHYTNKGSHPHNVHFHGTHDVNQDGWEPVPVGGEVTYRFTAEPFGVHPYHCHALPVSEHMAHGLYGTMIVDPPGGRPAARELVLAFSGFDLDGDGQNDLYAWNGVAGFFARYPIKVPVGELVRIYLVNLSASDPSVSFHLHAQTFDLYRTGTRLVPDERTDTVTLGPLERAILEFRLPTRGRYMFQPHQQRMAEAGAMGWLAAT
ncbi:MAG: multicopper oxidase domain-containing protein [Gemmatimonadota bacterium]